MRVDAYDRPNALRQIRLTSSLIYKQRLRSKFNTPTYVHSSWFVLRLKVADGLLRVREVPGSNVGVNTGCSDSSLSWFLFVPPGNTG